MSLIYYKKNQLTFIYNKKIVNILLYLKSFIRNNNNLNISDTYNSLSIYNTSFNKNYKNSVGLSLNNKELIYTHKLNLLLSFKLYSSVSNKLKTGLISYFEKDLTIISSNLINKIYKSLLILKSIKGGFISYSYGFKGFIPKNQFVFFKKKFIIDLYLFFSKTQTFLTILNTVIKKKNKLYRFSFLKTKITKLIPYSKTKNYSLYKKKKKKVLSIRII